MIPVILAVSAKQDGSVNKILEGIKKQALVLGQGIGVNLIPPSALTGLTAAQTQMGVLAQRARDVSKEMAEVRAQLNNVAKTPGIQGQTDALRSAQDRLRAIGAANGDVIRSNRQLESSYKTLTESAGNGLQKVAERCQKLASLGQIVTGAFAGVGTVFGGAAAGALAIAGNFEQLNAKLISVTGSVEVAAEKFAFAQKFAAQTPFDVEGIVSATAVLEGFGLKSEQILPVAANLASAMGTSLSEATLTIGKAAAGSLEGFESLRNTYAISTSDLKKFGLQVDKTGQILSRTPAQVEKNRNALIQLINLRYGDAVARQSNTLQGALSNLGDSAAQAAAGFGKSLIPAATFAARTFEGLLGVVNDIPGPLKAIAAVSAVVVAGVAGVGGAAVGAATGLLLLKTQLLEIGAEGGPVAARGLFLVEGGLARLTAGAGFARGALAFFTTTPLGLVLTGIGVASAAAAAAIYDYGTKAEAAGVKITESSRKVVSVNQAIRQSIAIVNDAGKSVGVSVSRVADDVKQIENISAALKALPAEQVVTTFAKMGISSQSLRKKLDELEGTYKRQGSALDDLKGQLSDLDKLIAFQEADFKTGGREFGPDQADIARAELLREQIRRLAFEFGNTNVAVKTFKELLATATPLENALADVVTESKNLTTVLDLGEKVKSANSLATSLGLVEAQIAKNAQAAGIGSSSLDALFSKLAALPAGAGFDQQREAIKAQIGLLQDKQSIVDAQAKREEDAQKAVLDANQNAFERKKALQGQTLQQELTFVRSQLSIVKGGSDEETALLTKQVQLKQQIREKDAAHAQKLFQNVLKASSTDVKDAQGNEDTQGVVEALQQARESVDAWANANKGLVRTYPAIQAEISKFRADNSVQLKGAETRLLAANYQRLGQDIQTALANAVNNTQRLDAVNTSLAATQASRRLGLISEAQAQTQINQLTKQKEQTEKAITAEKAAQAQAIASQQLSNAELDLQILQARKADGERVDQDILKAQKAIFAQKLASIEQEKQAAIDAANGEASAIAAIEQQAKLKREGLITQETLARKSAADQQTQAVNQALGQQEQRYQQFADRIGGPNSPIQSALEAFSGPGAFNFGKTFSLNEQLTSAGTNTTNAVNSFRNLQSQVQGEARGPNAKAQEITRQINEAERDRNNLRRSGIDPRQGLGGSAGGGQGAAGGGTIVSIYVDGAKWGRGDDEVENLTHGVLKKIATQRRMRGI